MKDCLIGLDIGTTGTKALLIDIHGKILASSYRSYRCENRKPGYSEQDARDWWKAACETVRECCEKSERGNDVAAISLSTQGGTFVPVDASGNPLKAAVLWNDTRCWAEKEETALTLGEQYIYDTTGWSLCDSMNAMQILWMKKHEPEMFGRVAKFLSVPDYMTGKMTGRYAVDLSNGGINQMVNITAGEWDDKILSFLGVSGNQLPDVVPSGEMAGTLTKDAARELGLRKGVPVISGGHDQYCVALGAGAIESGDVVIGTGTAWVVTAITDAPCISGAQRSRHTVRGKWGELLSVITGGACLEWLRKNICPLSGGEPLPFDEINDHVKKIEAGADGMTFYPYLAGAPYPLTRSDFRGAFTGLDLAHGKYHMARAVMEGVAYQIAWILETFRLAGYKMKEIKILGGASKSDVWTQIIADITGVPLLVPQVADIACVGAAVLAGVGCGLFHSFREGTEALAADFCHISPGRNARVYPALFEKFKDHAAAAGGLDKLTV
ncbi:xylulokinase [Christensenella intestinihominis]|uniref:xylulokinase n=1 Tax=Christensenella intestinihominis TaxID=1851429 RepID=UPI0008354C90|nr:FGGY family carbohydrate kinase [Christensenella intestinihominis]